MKLEDLPETLTPAVLEGGYLLYVCREGWGISPHISAAKWGSTTRPEDVVHLLEYPARAPGWYHARGREAGSERVFWWDGDAWRSGPNGALCGPISEDGLTITPITINDKEN